MAGKSRYSLACSLWLVRKISLANPKSDPGPSIGFLHLRKWPEVDEFNLIRPPHTPPHVAGGSPAAVACSWVPTWHMLSTGTWRASWGVSAAPWPVTLAERA